MQQINALNWNCRIGFAMRGEPTMHPEYAEMVAVGARSIARGRHITMLSERRRHAPVAGRAWPTCARCSTRA
jgi:hypothetical protein